MKTKTVIAWALSAAAALGLVICSDLRNRSAIAAEVDRVYLAIGSKPSLVEQSLLDDAGQKIDRHLGRILILPKASQEQASSLIIDQSFTLDGTMTEIERRLSLMTNSDTISGTALMAAIGKHKEDYANSVLKFKERLSYIRRSL